MKNTITQLKKSKEEFEEKFEDYLGCAYEEKEDANLGEEMTSFLTQSSHDLILAICEDLEERKKDGGHSITCSHNRNVKKLCNCGRLEKIIHDKTLQDIQDSLREVLVDKL